MWVYCRYNIITFFFAAVPCHHSLRCWGGGRVIGGGGPGNNIPVHHGGLSELVGIYWKYKAIFGANFDVPQDPRRGFLRGIRRH